MTDHYQGPTIIRERGGYRLVHQVRDQHVWPNVSDLTLEVQSTDAMGQDRWVYAYSWCLSAREHGPSNESDHAHLALKLLVDPTHPIMKEKK